MAANVTFHVVDEQGWRRGFANILRYEHSKWWRTRRWWINILIWLVLVNGIVLASLSATQEAVPGRPATPAEAVILEGVMIFAVTTGVFASIGAVIIMQGAIIDEKKSGTAAWIMSKPASRTAFIVAKLLANSIALLIIILGIQGAVAYLQFYQYTGSPLPLGPFLGGVALLGLHLLFYLSFTLMLGTVFNDRGPVIAIPMGVLFSASFVAGYLGPLVNILPWRLVPGGSDSGLAMQVMTGQPLTSVIPILATIVWIVVFISVAIWRFQREEF